MEAKRFSVMMPTPCRVKDCKSLQLKKKEITLDFSMCLGRVMHSVGNGSVLLNLKRCFLFRD